MTRFTLTRAAALALCALAVSGCSLLSSPDPVQTYRFGGGSGPVVEAGPNSSLRQVALRMVEMPEAAEGDRILGVTGTETAWIKGARWVSRAQDLYMDSLENAFAAQSTRVRLIGPREQTPGQRTLNIDIRAFEARYSAPGSAPTVVITARARMLALPDRAVAAERTFTVEQPATANRVGAIVEAFDVATRDLNTEIVAWTDANAG